MGDVLGKGSTACVIAHLGDDGTMRAVKEIGVNWYDEEEVSLLSTLSDEFVVKAIISLVRTPYRAYRIEMEYAPDLMKLIRAHKREDGVYMMDRRGCERICVQLAGAVAYLHLMGVCHRDIKPANVGITQTGRVKLMDLGLSLRVDLTKELRNFDTNVYTLWWRPPELLLDERRDHDPFLADIWACGVVFLEVFSGHNPFAADRELTVKERMNRFLTLKEYREDVLLSVTRKMVSIVARCLVEEKRGRICASECSRQMEEAFVGTTTALRRLQRGVECC